MPYKTANCFILDLLDQFDCVLNIRLPRNEPVLVHCNSGKDRTGLLLAYYLITRKELSAKKALKAVRRQKPDAMTATGFVEVLFALEPEMIERRKVSRR